MCNRPYSPCISFRPRARRGAITLETKLINFFDNARSADPFRIYALPVNYYFAEHGTPPTSEPLAEGRRGELVCFTRGERANSWRTGAAAAAALNNNLRRRPNDGRDRIYRLPPSPLPPIVCVRCCFIAPAVDNNSNNNNNKVTVTGAVRLPDGIGRESPSKSIRFPVSGTGPS